MKGNINKGWGKEVPAGSCADLNRHAEDSNPSLMQEHLNLKQQRKPEKYAWSTVPTTSLPTPAHGQVAMLGLTAVVLLNL